MVLDTSLGRLVALEFLSDEVAKPSCDALRDRLCADYRRGGPFAYAMAIVGAGLGKRDEAISWLQQVYAERHPQGLWMKVDPELEPLRSDPRYQALIRDTGL